MFTQKAMFVPMCVNLTLPVYHCISLPTCVYIYLTPMFQIVVLRGDRVVFTQNAMYEPTSSSIHPGMMEVAIGGNVSTHVLPYSILPDGL